MVWRGGAGGCKNCLQWLKNIWQAIQHQAHHPQCWELMPCLGNTIIIHRKCLSSAQMPVASDRLRHYWRKCRVIHHHTYVTKIAVSYAQHKGFKHCGTKENHGEVLMQALSRNTHLRFFLTELVFLSAVFMVPVAHIIKCFGLCKMECEGTNHPLRAHHLFMWQKPMTQSPVVEY